VVTPVSPRECISFSAAFNIWLRRLTLPARFALAAIRLQYSSPNPPRGSFPRWLELQESWSIYLTRAADINIVSAHSVWYHDLGQIEPGSDSAVLRLRLKTHKKGAAFEIQSNAL
jgi:hypothetical protein